MQWSFELGEFDVQYLPRTTFKGQAMADFLVGFGEDSQSPTIIDPHRAVWVWTLDMVK